MLSRIKDSRERLGVFKRRRCVEAPPDTSEDVLWRGECHVGLACWALGYRQTDSL